MLYRIGALGTVTAAPGAREALGVARAVRVSPTSFAAPARSAAARVEPLVVTPPPRPVVVAVPRPVAPPVVSRPVAPPAVRDPVAEARDAFDGVSAEEKSRPHFVPAVRPEAYGAPRPRPAIVEVPARPPVVVSPPPTDVADTRTPSPSPAPDLVKAPVSASIDIPGELWIGAGIFAAAVVLGGIYLATRHLSPKRGR